MHQYYVIAKIGEGTFSEVLKAKSIKTGQLVAIKCMKSNYDSIVHIYNIIRIKWRI